MLDRRSFVTVSLGTVSALVLAGCSKGGSDSDVAPAKDGSSSDGAKGKKVIFLVSGNLGDKGFYDSTARGINTLASDYGCETKIVEMGRDETTYEATLRDVSDQDWDLIVCSTFSMREVLEGVAPDYPDKSYVLLDVTSTVPNILGVSFPGNEAGFLAGTVAGNYILENFPDNKVAGFIGSMDAQGINDFLVGYIEGVKNVDESIKVNTSYVGSFEDVATCLEMTTQLYNQGAEVVYAPASQSIMGAVTASSNTGKALIGCDTDIYSELIDSQPDLVQHVLTSSLKRLDEATIKSATGLWDGSLKVGTPVNMDVAYGAIGLADNDNYQKLVSEDTRKKVDEVTQKIASGEIKPKSAFDMDTEELTKMRDGAKA